MASKSTPTLPERNNTSPISRNSGIGASAVFVSEEDTLSISSPLPRSPSRITTPRTFTTRKAMKTGKPVSITKSSSVRAPDSRTGQSIY